MELLNNTWATLLLLLTSPLGQGWWDLILKLIPFVIFLELPVYVVILLGIVRYALRLDLQIPEERSYYPKVTCLIPCYSEGQAVQRTIKSLLLQNYPGKIETIVIVDGAEQNRHTYQAALAMMPFFDGNARRRLQVIPKWQRGGKVSSLNMGFQLTTDEIVFALDGDISFDYNMVLNATQHFADPGVVGLAGSLRVRNARVNLVTRIQALEYMLTIQAAKVGLNEFNAVNIISGALGAFRREFVLKIGGFDSGSAEDLDLVLRIKSYFGRHPGLRIVFEPRVMGYTDAPETWRGFFKQRMRWDGDLYYLYVRKHHLAFAPRLMGWSNLFFQVWTGLFFQLVMPFIILFYSLAIFTLYPPHFVFAIWILIYLMYMVVALLFFLAYIVVISDRRVEDLQLSLLLVILPLYTYAQRIWNALATLKEATCKAHLDSSMAPWWVLRNSKF
jgi:cellulose synthase/poly-beta-1,6-N-acetylglucosamine synthase-like glycosyltransferase